MFCLLIVINKFISRYLKISPISPYKYVIFVGKNRGIFFFLIVLFLFFPSERLHENNVYDYAFGDQKILAERVRKSKENIYKTESKTKYKYIHKCAYPEAHCL